jgi:hypothetical protein
MGGGPAKTPAKGANKSARHRAETKVVAKAEAPPGDGPRLLSGGNPQIPKGYGDAPVKAYIAAMPAGNATSADASMRRSERRCRASKKP